MAISDPIFGTTNFLIVELIQIFEPTFDPLNFTPSIRYTSTTDDLIQYLIDIIGGGGGGGGGTFWRVGGNNNGSAQNIGTKDNFRFPVIVNNGEVWAWETSGNITRNGTLFSLASGTNTTWGQSAGAATTTGNQNTLIGYQAGILIQAGQNCTFIGKGAGAAYVNGVQSTFVGNDAGSGTTGDKNTYFGHCAGNQQTTGVFNVAVGVNAGRNFFSAYGNYTGDANVFVGVGAGDGNKTGSYNIFMGLQSGYNVQDGVRNIIIGNAVIGTAFGAGGITQPFPAANNADCLGFGNLVAFTKSNQIVFGSATYFYQDIQVAYSATGVHGKYFRTSTPEAAQAAQRGSMAHVDDGAIGSAYIKTSGTGAAGWDQIASLLAAQTFGTGAKTFNSSILKVRNPGDTFSYTVASSPIAADRTVTLPALTGNDTFAFLAFSQTFTAAQTFNSSILKVRNPGDTFSYTIVGSAIGANRNLTIPLLTGDDTIMVLGLNQTVSGVLTLTTPNIGAATGTSLAVSGGLTSSGIASSAVGYAAGAGSTVTQITSKATGVTLNNICGQITMNNAVLNAATSVQFTFTNSRIAATDVVLVTIASGATASSYQVQVDATAAGSCKITVRNYTAGNLSEAIVLNYAVIKAVAA